MATQAQILVAQALGYYVVQGPPIATEPLDPRMGKWFWGNQQKSLWPWRADGSSYSSEADAWVAVIAYSLG